jgi:hypothetical protein
MFCEKKKFVSSPANYIKLIYLILAAYYICALRPVGSTI